MYVQNLIHKWETNILAWPVLPKKKEKRKRKKENEVVVGSHDMDM